MSAWAPSKSDVLLLCDAVLDGYVVATSSGDSCTHCGFRYGNREDYSVLPHHPGCPVPVALDVSTGANQTTNNNGVV